MACLIEGEEIVEFYCGLIAWERRFGDYSKQLFSAIVDRFSQVLEVEIPKSAPKSPWLARA